MAKRKKTPSQIDEWKLLASVCRSSLYQYVRHAWGHVEAVPFVDSWHIRAICEHLEAVTNNQIPKLLINIPPGCSKSLLTSVFWPTWEWARDASTRWFFASYDQRLSTRDSVKSRTLMQGKWYNQAFPDQVILMGDQNQKTYYETDKGGFRLSTSVGGHGTGEHPDRIVCFPAGTAVRTLGGDRTIEKIAVGDLVLGCDHPNNLLGWFPVTRLYQRRAAQLIELETTHGTIRLTHEHPVYVEDRGYVGASQVDVGDMVWYADFQLRGLWEQVSGVSSLCGEECEPFLFQTLSGKRTDGREPSELGRRQAEMCGVWGSDNYGVGEAERDRPFLFAGMSKMAYEKRRIAEERTDGGNAQKNNPAHLGTRQSCLRDLQGVGEFGRSSYKWGLERQPPRKSLPCLPSLPFQDSQCRSESITRAVVLSRRVVAHGGDVFNIEVAHTNNYFAEGVLVHNCDDPHNVREAESEIERQNTLDWWDQTMSTRGVARNCRRVVIMQRLHESDLSGHLLQKGDWAHICLPMRYEAGRMKTTILGWTDPRKIEGELLTPNQFDEAKLQDMEKSLGMYGTAGQLQQRPTPKEGGLFKAWFFNSRRSAAPYHAKRVRYWDTAGTQSDGDATVGTLMAKDDDGDYYVENVVWGQWEPGERDNHILATAKRDRVRYGPNDEPTIWIERGMADAGISAFKHLAKKLSGFRVFAHKPTGDKVLRATSFASQCAALNVHLVEDKSWDINAWIAELCAFPMGKWVDRVDSASGAFGRLEATRVAQGIRIYHARSQTKKTEIRVVVCSAAELREMIIEDPSLLVSISSTSDQTPQHGLSRLVDFLILPVNDVDAAERQDRWEEPVPPWNLPPAQLLMTPESGKKLWGFLLKTRQINPTVIVVQDDGGTDRRAQSIAYAIVDVLRGGRKLIYRPTGVDNKDDGPAPNQTIYACVKKGRSMVAI